MGVIHNRSDFLVRLLQATGEAKAGIVPVRENALSRCLVPQEAPFFPPMPKARTHGCKGPTPNLILVASCRFELGLRKSRGAGHTPAWHLAHTQSWKLQILPIHENSALAIAMAFCSTLGATCHPPCKRLGSARCLGFTFAVQQH